MTALAWRFRIPIAAMCAVLALMWALNRYVADAVHDDRLQATVEAQKADARADDLAGQVAASETAQTEQENTQARKAAAGSSDPLADGLRALRKK